MTSIACTFAEQRRVAGIATPLLVPIVLLPPPARLALRSRRARSRRPAPAEAAEQTLAPTPAAAPAEAQPQPPVLAEDEALSPSELGVGAVPPTDQPATPERSPHVCRPAGPTRELLEARRGITHKDIKGDREAELVRRYQAGDRNAGEILLRAHAKLIAFAAKKWSRGRHDVPEEDLLTEAQLAFLHGVEKFDEAHGVKLATYAPLWIRQAMTLAKCEQGHTIYVPVRHHVASEKVKCEELWQAGQRALSVGRLDAPIGDDDGACLGDLVAGADNPEDDLAEREWGAVSAEMLTATLAALPPRAADILRRRAEGETLEEIGQSFGLSRERVRQLEVLAKERARKLIGRVGRLHLAETD